MKYESTSTQPLALPHKSSSSVPPWDDVVFHDVHFWQDGGIRKCAPIVLQEGGKILFCEFCDNY